MTRRKPATPPKRTRRKAAEKPVEAVAPVPAPLRPEPDARDLAAGLEARARVLARTERPRVVAGREPETTQSPHRDEALFSAALLDICGTTSPDFADRVVRQLSTALHREGADGIKGLNMALAAMGGVRPENEVEAMLGVQMVATHDAAMRMLELTKRELTPEAVTVLGGFATRLLRTFALQAEALAELRRGGEQVVKVVHVHAGAQAVVGTVNNHQGGGGGEFENRRQPHAPAALAYQPVAPLWSDDPSGDAVPSPSGGREGPLPDARRRSRQRRTPR